MTGNMCQSMHVTMEAIFWFCWFDLGIQQPLLCTFVNEWSGKEKKGGGLA